MAKQQDKEPRAWEIATAAVLSVIVGVVGAVAFLVFQPVEEVSELPSEEERELGKVYFVEGGSGDSSHGTWEPKEEVVKTQRRGKITLVEEELNQWAAARLGEGENGEDGKPALHVAPGVPNFRLDEERVFVSVPLEWNIFGLSRTFDSQTSGTIEAQGGTHVLIHDRVYVGSCPVPGFLGKRLVADVVAAYDVPEELREGWASLESVELGEEGLALVIP